MVLANTVTPPTPDTDDHSRVKLREDYTEDGRDYINASFIVDTDPQHPKYIATQAPLEKTIADFWQVRVPLPHLKIHKSALMIFIHTILVRDVVKVCSPCIVLKISCRKNYSQ